MKKTNTTNWEIKTLGEVCQIRPPKSEVRTLLKAEDIVSFVPMEDLKVLSKKFPTPKERMLKDVAKSYTYFADGDVLMAKITPCFENGKLGIAQNLRNGIGFGSSEFIVFRTRKKILHPIFLFYLLSSSSFREQGKKVMSGAVGHKRVPEEYVENYKFLLPPLPEQKRIVKILDEKFGVIEELQNITKKQIADVKELFESRLGEVFSSPDASWHEVVFCDVCKITSKLIDPKEKKYENLVHVGAGNIIAETGELVNLKTAKEEKLISGKFIFDTEMVLYSKIRPYLMKTVRPDFSGLCSADIYPLKPKDDVLIRDFLYYLLFSKQFTEYAIKGSARAGMPKVNREHMFAYSFFLPGIKKQKQLVKELDELSKKTKELEATFLRKTADLEELKKSYLADAFAGKL